MKPILDIINNLTFICLFESRKCGKQEKTIGVTNIRITGE